MFTLLRNVLQKKKPTIALKTLILKLRERKKIFAAYLKRKKKKSENTLRLRYFLLHFSET